MNDTIWPAMTWHVTLTTGDILLIAADATFVDGEDQIFEVATPAIPPTLIEVARLPKGLISDLASEPRGS